MLRGEKVAEESRLLTGYLLLLSAASSVYLWQGLFATQIGYFKSNQCAWPQRLRTFFPPACNPDTFGAEHIFFYSG